MARGTRNDNEPDAAVVFATVLCTRARAALHSEGRERRSNDGTPPYDTHGDGKVFGVIFIPLFCWCIFFSLLN